MNLNRMPTTLSQRSVTDVVQIISRPHADSKMPYATRVEKQGTYQQYVFHALPPDVDKPKVATIRNHILTESVETPIASKQNELI